jgi:D-xylose transport system substrate-binding protein
MKKSSLILVLFFGIMSGTFAQDSLKIGFSIGDFSSDRWSQEPQIFQNAAKNLGAKVLFEFAYGDAEKQVEQARSLIASGVKVLVVFPTDANGWADVVKAAHKANIKVVAYERMLTDANPDYFFSFRNEDVGRQQAQYAVDHCPKGNYILLEGPTNDANSLLFEKGQQAVLKPYIDKGQIHVLLEKNLETWNSINAYNEITAFLDKNKEKVDVIIAANDELAGGSIMALDMEMPAWNIIITGQDATVGGCQHILDGKQSMTVYKSIHDLATEAAANCMKLAKGEALTNVNSKMSDGSHDIPAVLLPTEIVDKNNMRETVIKDGFIKADQLKFNP